MATRERLGEIETAVEVVPSARVFTRLILSVRVLENWNNSGV